MSDFNALLQPHTLSNEKVSAFPWKERDVIILGAEGGVNLFQGDIQWIVPIIKMRAKLGVAVIKQATCSYPTIDTR